MMPSIKVLDRACLAIVVIVSLICGSWVVSQSITQRRKIQQENALLARRLKELNLAETNVQKIETVLHATMRELHHLNERISEAANIGELLKDIDSLIKKRKIVLVSLRPQPPVREKHYSKVQFCLRFRGAFLDIYHLLHDLETMNPVLVMEKMLITNANKDRECQVDLTACILAR